MVDGYPNNGWSTEDSMYETVVLKKIKIGISTRLPNIFLHDMHVQKEMDMLTNDFVYRLTAYIYGDEDHITSAVHRYPETWKEGLKEELYKKKWFPIFVKKKYPIKYKEVVERVHITRTCPHINVASPHEHVRFVIKKES